MAVINDGLLNNTRFQVFRHLKDIIKCCVLELACLCYKALFAESSNVASEIYCCVVRLVVYKQ